MADGTKDHDCRYPAPPWLPPGHQYGPLLQSKRLGLASQLLLQPVNDENASEWVKLPAINSLMNGVSNKYNSPIVYQEIYIIAIFTSRYMFSNLCKINGL